MDRDCNNCIHHTSGACSSWDCEMMTVEDYRNKAIDEFAEKVVAELEKAKGHYGYYGSEECEYVPYETAIDIVRNAGKGE